MSRVALVTGGTRGIGRAIALHQAAQHSQLVLVARDAQALAELDAEVQALGAPAAMCAALDLTDADAIGNLFKQVFARFGHLDGLVNNAGLLHEGLLGMIRAERPDDSILSEESGEAEDGTTGLRWLVDPLDGTTNFLHGYPQVAISIALEVRGDSMVDAGILDGDMALIQRNDVANTGDIVVALIDEEEATLKRFRRRGASIALEPANTAYEVRILPPNRVRIQGKLIGLYHKY